jgi:RNA polymerase sigma-70 factor (ECF subfamily)
VATLKLIDRAGVRREADLVEACRQGDRAALQVVFTEHAQFLERLLVRVVGRVDEVEDLLQMTFLAAMRAFPGFRGEARVRTWLSRIAVRTAQEHLRRPERTRRARISLVEEICAGDEPRAPDRSLETKRLLQRLYHHLDAIAPKKRVAFVLHVFEGYPVEQVAALVGASLTATKSRVFWARRELLARARRDPALRGMLEGEALP